MTSPALPPVVVLAAGRSSRLGVPKGLVVVDGRPWIEHQIEGVLTAGAARAIVVLGHDRERYAGVAALARRATVVVNPAPERGSFSSLQAGLAAIAPDEAAFVLPVDVPAASPPAWAALAAALTTGGALAAVPAGGGHPVLLSATFVARLRSLDPAATDESRLDWQLALVGPAAARVPVQDGRVRLNLNAPEDWGRLVKGR